MRLAAKSMTFTPPMKPSRLIARVTFFDCNEIGVVPRGEYWRNAANGSLEGNVAIERRNPCREGVEELLDGLLGENDRAVMEHLGGPLDRGILRHRVREEEGPAGPECLPPLRERAARVLRFDDDRRIRDEGHGPVPEREVLPLDWMASRVLGDGEMLAHDLVLERGILPGIDLVERGPEHRDGSSTVLDGVSVGGGVNPLGKPAHDHHA